MKIKTLVAFVASYVAAAGSSFAQDFSHLFFEGAGGVSVPVGSAGNRLNTGYNFLLGAGWRFNPNVAGMLEFQYDRFSLNNNALQSFQQPDGYNSFWS